MGKERKQLPRSNVTRLAALVTGKRKMDSMGPDNFVSAAVSAQLNTLTTACTNARRALNRAKAKFTDANNQKDKDSEECELLNSCFVQVFMLGIKRRIFPHGANAYYELPSSGELPDMNTDAKRLLFAKTIIAGDAKRMAEPGAVPMAMPSIAEVEVAMQALEDSLNAQNRTKENLKTAQRNYKELNRQAGPCIRSLWAEVETHYINLPKATMRDIARLWGVIYVRVGNKKTVKGSVVDAGTGEIIIGATIYFENGSNETESTTDGYTLNTTLMSVQKLIAVHPLYVQFEKEITLVEGENQEIDIEMVVP